MSNLDNYPLLTDETRKKMEDVIKQSPKMYQQADAYFYQAFKVPQSYLKKVDDFYYPLEQFDVPYDKEKHREVFEDLENIKRVYGSMRHLPLSIATNFNFWGGLTHTVYWSYMQHRWPSSNQSSSSKIVTRYLNKEQPRSRNGIARLWWLGYLTYREELENPWYYTEIMMKSKDSDLPRMIAESPTTGINPKAVNAILIRIHSLESEEWYKKLKHSKKTSVRNLFRVYFSRYNMYGGVKAWSALNQEELNQQCNNYILDYLCEERIITNSQKQQIEIEYNAETPK